MAASRPKQIILASKPCDWVLEYVGRGMCLTHVRCQIKMYDEWEGVAVHGETMQQISDSETLSKMKQLFSVDYRLFSTDFQRLHSFDSEIEKQRRGLKDV